MTDHDPPVLINAFEVPGDRDDELVAGWTAACEFLERERFRAAAAGLVGFQSHPGLHRVART